MTTLHNTFTMSDTLAEAIRAFASTDKTLDGAKLRAGKAAVAAIDTLAANSWIWTDLLPVGKTDANGVQSTASEEGLAFVTSNIVATFTETDQALLDDEQFGEKLASAKANKVQALKARRRNRQQQVGSKIGKLRSALKKREVVAIQEKALADKAAAQGEVVTAEQVAESKFYLSIDDTLTRWKDRADREADKLVSLDVEAFKREIAKLQAMIRKANK